MNFYSVRDLRTDSKSLWETLRDNGEAVITNNGKPASIVHAVLSRNLTVCYDYRIVNEYYNVLRRPKFAFSEWEIQSLLGVIISNGISVIADSLADIPFADETDKKFYEVAKFCNALLIMGNIKHFPTDNCVITVADFYQKYL
ncbi:MAG: hypothetical protein NC429_06005 [Lachnospiraceae bacterium]|nr:hypothetical protein [Lachnospiraceae bacterium]